MYTLTGEAPNGTGRRKRYGKSRGEPEEKRVGTPEKYSRNFSKGKTSTPVKRERKREVDSTSTRGANTF